ncbi:hypothetical protein [Pseudonocardia xishanensis]|uniref:Uncharacterized protein n=1 Tax=Pseudonocardia xishanensis TaxID=630995 RepID=A0ABP8S0I6_9PSEU
MTDGSVGDVAVQLTLTAFLLGLGPARRRGRRSCATSPRAPFTAYALFAFISGATFVFQEIYGLSPTGYGVVFGTSCVGMVCAGLVFGVPARGSGSTACSARACSSHSAGCSGPGSARRPGCAPRR